MEVQKFREQIYHAALPLLEGRTVADLVIGISMLAVELDGKDLAVSYVLRDDLGGGCSIFSYANQAVGMSAREVGSWFVTGGDDIQRAIGGAVLNAASHSLDLIDSSDREHPFDLNLSQEDTVGMVGHIQPVAMQLKEHGCRMVIFDKGKCAMGKPAEDIYPMEQQARMMPECDVVFLSGTTTINGTAASLLEQCSKARDVVLVGASVPMIPAGYAGTPVTVLAGSWWDHKDKAVIFRLISQAGGMQALKPYAIKKNVRVR